mgnify:CR=1 FL=1
MSYTSIAISGQIASGTSTAAKSAASALNLKYESAGDFFRAYMLENNFPLWDKSKIPDDLDQEIDEKLTALAKEGGYVVDAHYIGYFTKDMPNVLRVLLACESQERYKRAISRHHTHTETIEEIKKREDGLDSKFRKLYADEFYIDPKFFDLKIDTTNTTPDEVKEKIVAKFKEN